MFYNVFHTFYKLQSDSRKFINIYLVISSKKEELATLKCFLILF